MRFQSGVTDQVIFFVAVDATDLKTRETGLTSFTVYRARDTGAATAYTTPTVAELSSSNMPGVYSLLLDEDMTIGSGNDSEAVVLHITQASMAPVTLTYELYRPIVTAGTTVTVANGAVDADLERIQGTVVSTPATAGILDVNLKNIANATVSTSSAQLGVNVVNAAGTAWGSGAITAASIASDAITAAKIADNAIDAGSIASNAITSAKIATGAITAATFASGAIDAAALAADAGTEIGTAVWATAARTLTANTNLNDLNAAGIRAAVGLASANLDTQLTTIDDFLDTEVGAIKTKTDFLPSATAGSAGGIFIAGTNAATTVTTSFTTTFTGNLTGSVGSVTGLTASNLDTTVSSRLASAAYTTPPTAAAIVDAVWDEAIADHDTVSGSMAEQLSAAGSAGDPWATALPGAYSAGQAGKIIGDNLNATVGSRATQTSVDTVDTVADAIKAKTDSLTFGVAGKVDANITHVNETEITGDGESGTEFGPA